jgi:UDP-glucuronate decarboxylase
MMEKSIINDIEEKFSDLDSSFFQNKSILITGASGLIGTYILGYIVFLNKQGYNINAFSHSFSEPSLHMKELLRDGEVRHIKADLSDTEQYQKLPEVDIVIHAAGYAQPTLFMADPLTTISINVTATIALLDHLKPDGTFIFISSAEVYCGQKITPFNEEQIGVSTPYHPRSSYIEGKRCGEAVCAAARKQGVRAISIRLGDIYGPGTRANDKRALNSFIQRALVNDEIKLLDQGLAKRTYFYITDALESIINIIIYGKEPVYNVGGEIVTSIAELAKLIGSITGVEVITPSHEENIIGSPPTLQLNTERLKKEFGYKKNIDLSEGLQRTIEWQKRLYLD